jgi:ABC-type nitrate/sulfonate/bicarbonate transport system substrate-binding protein
MFRVVSRLGCGHVSVLLAAGLATVAAGCGGGGSSDSATGSGSGSGSAANTDLGSMKVVLPAVSDLSSLVAASGGKQSMFAKQGLDVGLTIVNPATIPSLIISGRADVGLGGIGVPLSISSQGKPAAILNSVLSGGAGGGMAVPKNSKIKSMDDLKAMGKNCTVVGSLQGQGAYASAQIVIKRAGLGCTFKPIADNAAQGPILASGGADAWFTSPIILDASVLAGKNRYIFDPRDKAQNARYLGAPYVESGAFTLDSTLKSKPKQMVAFEKGLADARAVIAKSTPEELYDKYLKSYKEVMALPKPSALNLIAVNKRFLCSGVPGCYISKQQWDATLHALGYFGIPNFNPSDPTYTYDQAIDTGPYTTANGTPAAN